MEQNKFKLFANCIPVKGASRSIICDLQRRDYQLIPNTLYDLLMSFPQFTLADLTDKYGKAEQETLEEYIAFLEEHEFGMWSKDHSSFVPLNLAWFSSSEITNSIVDWDKNSDFDFESLFDQLNNLNCLYLQLRFFDPFGKEQLEKVLCLLNRSSIVSVELFFHDSVEFQLDDYTRLLRRFPRITRLVVHSAKENRHFNEPEHFLDLIALNYTTLKIKDETHCGVIHPGYFSSNIEHFTEAKQYNSCLNKKISIDKSGQICNCPSLPQKFGQFGKTNLRETIQNEHFLSHWSTTKDQIETCKDCEFRYICSDCRAYTEENRPLGKPLKCNYNPYTGEWN